MGLRVPLRFRVGERLPVGVAEDAAILAQLHVGVIEDQGGGKRRSGI